MRIVHLCRVAPPSIGGMETMVAGLARRQAEEGHDVRIVTTMEEPPPNKKRSHLIPTAHLRMFGSPRYPFAWGLRAAIEDADIVHVHGIDGLADQVLTVRGPDTAVGISTHGGYLHTMDNWRFKQLFLRTWTRWSLRRADAIWYTSPADRDALSPARLPGAIVPNGVEIAPFRWAREHREAERGVFVYLGRVDVHKGLDRLFRTLVEIKKKDPTPFTLEIIGPVTDNSHMQAMETFGRALGLRENLSWRGTMHRDDIVQMLARCELAFFPSHHEGFGIALVETMGAGVAPIAQDIPAHAEMLTDGEHGELVDFDKPEETAAIIHQLRRKDRRKLEASAARRAEWFSWESVFPAWEKAYERMLDTRAGS